MERSRFPRLVAPMGRGLKRSVLFLESVFQNESNYQARLYRVSEGAIVRGYRAGLLPCRQCRVIPHLFRLLVTAQWLVIFDSWAVRPDLVLPEVERPQRRDALRFFSYSWLFLDSVLAALLEYVYDPQYLAIDIALEGPCPAQAPGVALAEIVPLRLAHLLYQEEKCS